MTREDLSLWESEFPHGVIQVKHEDIILLLHTHTSTRSQTICNTVHKGRSGSINMTGIIPHTPNVKLTPEPIEANQQEMVSRQKGKTWEVRSDPDPFSTAIRDGGVN